MRIEPGSSSRAAAYAERVNRAIDHVVRHLAEPLPLEAVADVAGFSPFHFHRIFRTVTGETLNRFVRRLRLERAIQRMVHGPATTWTDAALAAGFSSSSDFARCFKRRYGLPPSGLDLDRFRTERRREWSEAHAETAEPRAFARLPPGENPDRFEAAVRPLPARRVAYVRVHDPYRGGVPEAAERLVAWAERRGLADGQWLGYMWDDPEVVAAADCRYDVGVELPRSAVDGPDGEVGVLDFPPMRVAELELRGPIELEVRALDWLFGTWLPGSGYAPSDQPAFEAWIGRPFEHGTEHFELHAQLPVVPLAGR